ncbi:MAG: hypothetical protein HY059_11695 [Proteobacteria bacterium]|nr:hypothetical protein [Pseudomonadota bacterium]
MTPPNIDHARSQISHLARQLGDLRSKEADILARRRASLPLDPRDSMGAADIRELDASLVLVAGRIRDLEADIAAHQIVVGEHDRIEQARQRAEAAQQHQRDVARAAELASLRIGVAGQIDVKLAELATLAARFDELGFDLASLEHVTGISGMQLARENNLRGAVLATGSASLAKTFNAMRYADGDASLAATQRDLLACLNPTTAIAAE